MRLETQRRSVDGIHRFLGRSGAWMQRRVDRLYYHGIGRTERPVFYDVDRTYPALRLVDQNYDVIREELLSILPRIEEIPRYHEIHPREQRISESTAGNWRTFFLAVYGGGKSLPNRAKCPQTAAVLDRIPGLLSAFFSILDPGKCVPAHNGPHFFYLRYHTAFLVPREKPPRIKVKDQYYTWKERESVLFDDSWAHEVENQSESTRVVLVVDVIRPHPAWPRPLLKLALGTSVLAWNHLDWEHYYERMAIR
jgi:aspartyl/asparaginyl beta-hydroxylase (cupin superfamily)